MSEYNEQEVFIANGVRAAVSKYHSESVSRGWWTDASLDELLISHPTLHARLMPYVHATKIALIHSEVSEGLEGLRKKLKDDHLPHRSSIEVELADACIRIFDLAGRLGIDLPGAIIEKGRYNMQRPDHMAAARSAEGGKQF